MVNGSSYGDYGSIPLQSLDGFTNKGTNNGLKMSYADFHKLLNHRGISNCVDGQFEIPSDLNIPLLEHLHHRNRDHQLIS